MATRVPRLLLGVIAVVFAFAVVAFAEEFDNPKVKVAPKGKPARISGGESFPPLPLPATPLRRTERKREPSPPSLVGQIKLGKKAFKDVDGERVAVEAFPSVKVDLEALMDATNAQLKIKYKFQQDVEFEKFDYDPAALPILFFTGWKEFPGFDEKIRSDLVRYLTDGGTLIINSSCGRPEFNNSVMKAVAEVFPNRQLAPLPADHPIFHCFHEITELKVREGKIGKVASAANLGVFGLNIGSRTAVIFSPIDLSAGWDPVARPIEGGVLYEQGDAIKLGANMLTYSLACFEYARAFATEKVYFEKDDPTRDQLVLAQITHNGDWDPTPHGLPNLLKFMQDNSTLNVQFKRQVVKMTDVDVFKHPMLYMTGLRDFQLTATENKQLGNYLKSGGVLFADAAIGSKTFDAAFRLMIKQALPDAQLTLLKPNHPLFSSLFKVGQVELTSMAQKLYPDLKQPLVEAVVLNGKVVVIYSRLGLSNGWEKLAFPYNTGYADNDAFKLGANAVIYSMMGH
ncbi:MAG: DUF4159 domain-containing protein [Phycisphaerae bacterium]|nr:DUF4159 domain-containing protein [Phycisphaerae bacterium]